MNLIIFERTNFEISENNTYSLRYVHLINNEQKTFIRFINELIDFSKKFNTYINVYRLYKDHTIVKIAFIKCGNLFTL